MLILTSPDNEAIWIASQNWLQEVCAIAQEQKKYNSAHMWRGMRVLFVEHFSSAPYSWQLNLLATLDADVKNSQECENLVRWKVKLQERVHLQERKWLQTMYE